MGRRFIADDAGLFCCDIEVNGSVLTDAIDREQADEILQCTLNAALAVLAQDDPWTERFLDCVADFMLEKDRIFAELTLEPDELELYLRLHAQMVKSVPVPDLVIYLQAPVDILMDRIAHRGVHYESRIDPGYLERLAGAYTRFFYHYEDAPLVIVNAAEINLASGQEDYDMLFDQLRTIRRGRHYINPLPFDE